MYDVKDALQYLITAYKKVEGILVVLWAGINYIIFPDKAFISAAISVLCAMILDIITKYYALSKPYKSFWVAFKIKVINSNTFFEGTKKKLISFLILMILCGLTVRVFPIKDVAIFFGTIVYSIMFVREFQSCIENLIDAGHTELDWLIPILKKKEKDLINQCGGGDEEDDSNKTNVNKQ